MIRHPLMFSRIPKMRDPNSTKPTSYIVVLPMHLDETYVETAWQGNSDFPSGEMHQPSIDILDKKDTYIFDSDDSHENYRQALLKMKELWAQVEIPPKEE